MPGGGIAKPGGNAFNLALLDIAGATRGDLYTRGVDAWGRLPLGTSGFVLLSNGTDVFWAANPGGGDMLAAVYDPSAVVGDAFDLDNFDAPGSVRGAVYTKFAAGWGDLAPGTAGQVLTSGGGGADAAWANPAGNMLKATFDPNTVNGDAFDLANFRIASEAIGDLYARGIVDWERIPVGAANQVLVVDQVALRPNWATAPLPINHIDGVILTRPTAATVQIGVGSVKADDDVTDLIVSGALTADITNSGANGLDTGAEAADTWYFVWIIDGPTVSQASLLSLSSTAPTLPESYTVKRRVGTVRNDGSSDIIDFLQSGLERARAYVYLSSLSSRTLLSTGTAEVPTAVDLSSLVPPTTQGSSLTLDNKSNTRLMDVHQTTGGPILEELENSDSRSLLFPTSATQTVAYANDGGGGDANISVRGFLESV